MMSGATNILEELKRAHDSFIELRCCGMVIGLVNSRIFKREASLRMCEIMDRLGPTAWVEDPEARAMLADPSQCETPADGTPISCECRECGARFAWSGGAPKKVQAA